ncbi:linear amide C-N hydrolase [Clostridium tagluense]|uniref:linear amide C-N hydrolase n=1 Tax=Clostridium tagluense TaxID=360422 RepID=UPI001CF3C1D0|nr:linear amide C-N hydrolase [Clostridium tagluense]MCB2313770.1 linear amide C-N hydrolase [Clostridium tagluense]MCB2318587.1 linear amide C-N hydrolase [Clostridium tagluense]MCB2323433.1 linear amide C-N hydrolase [Clostridium tagluense]MCB2328274.1 linear amide C-N hydrolase [Clostridium tagluense]MCB2333069.1 linear amide C-N hydrolase [Clostridium tagluense]
MKKIIIPLICMLLIFNVAEEAYACTSFAVYANNKFYGMNFDWSDTDVNLSIKKVNGIKIFYFNVLMGGQSSQICAMNSEGLFVSIQAMYPEANVENTSGKNEIVTPELIGVVKDKGKVKEVKEYLNNVRLTNWHFSLHDFIADKYGDSIIVEPGNKKNEIIPTNNKFNVMTNFQNAMFVGKTYKEAHGTGDDRYRSAYEYLLENKDKFNLENGFQILEKTMQTSGEYKTQASMLFDPEKREIYIILKRDFNKVWKVSLDGETIETYKGFDKHIKYKLNENGMAGLNLKNPTQPVNSIVKNSKNISNHHSNLWQYAIIITLSIAVMFVFFRCLYRRKKA